jgi:hypothetical protein
MLPITRRPAWWLLAPGVILATLYIQQYIPSQRIIAHRESAVAASALLLIFSASLVSVTAAMEAGRDRASRGMTEVSVRSKISIVAARLWPCLTAGAIVQLVGIVQLLSKAGPTPDGFPVLITAGLLAALFVHAGIGFFMGTWLRPLFAVPLALAISYLWLGFAWSFDFVPVRYLAGVALEGCCSANETMDVSAVISLMTFSVVAFLGFVLMATGITDRKLTPRGTNKRMRVIAGITTLGLATSLGLFVARDVGVVPTVPLPLSDAECSNTSPEVCFLPVQLARGDTRQVYADTFAELAAVGMPTIAKVISVSGDQEPVLSAAGVANVVATPGQSRSSALQSAASTYAVAVSEHECGGDASPDLYGWSEVLKVWLVHTAALEVLDPDERDGIPDTSILDGNSGPGEMDFAGQWEILQEADERAQIDWATSAFSELSMCRVPAPIKPGQK